MPQNNNEFPVANITWQRKIEILKLLASHQTKVAAIASQYYTNEKAIYRLRLRALSYPSNLKATLPQEVQDYLMEWGLVHHPELIEQSTTQEDTLNKRNSEKHVEDLAQAAREVLRRLYTYIPWNEDTTIEDINLEKDDVEATGFFTDKIIIGLFAHLQNDIQIFQKRKMWEELKVKNITAQLLDEISLKAANRDFHGRCEVCKDWDYAI